MSDFEIFLVTAPGLEAELLKEARAKQFRQAEAVKGGVTVRGDWPEVWRANLQLRGAARVLARIGEFRALHLAQLDKRARKLPWAEILRPDVPVRVEAACKRSRIYHAGAASQRIATAIAEELGAPISDEAELVVKLRIDDDLCSVSIDSSGEALHKREHKQAVNKAPMRENLAALFLSMCGYDGSQAVLNPMCGSGTFVIEAAEIAAGLYPGRSRSFAFEQLAGFDAGLWAKMKGQGGKAGEASVRFFGSDRDAGAIEMSRANAERAGLAGWTSFAKASVSDIAPPEGVAPGIVIVNPPYGGRIGEKKALISLYAALGQSLRARFMGWRVGIITNESWLAKAAGLPFQEPSAPVSHGGIGVRLYQTGPLD